MVIGILQVESTLKVANNPFYGDYEVKTTLSKNIVDEKYVGLVPPKNGIKITLKDKNETIDFIIGKYAFTGEDEKYYDEESTEFSSSFTFNGSIWEVTVDVNGGFVSLEEWLYKGDFEDGKVPDNRYTKSDECITWKPLDM